MKPSNPSPLAADFLAKGYSEDCPLIETHAHYGPYQGAYLPVEPHEKMVRTFRRAGVTKALCSSHEAILGEVDAGNAMTQEVVNGEPELFAGYWVVNPRNADHMARLVSDYENTRGFVGFKLGPEYHTYPLDGPGYAPALEYADAHKLIVLVHTWGGSAFDSPQQVATVAGRYPQVAFLMGHSGFGDFETAVAVARHYEHAYLELTCVYAAHDFAMLPAGSSTPVQLASSLHVNGIIEYMVEHATSKKIVFGTDMPWYSPHFAAGAVMYARIDDEARKDICHRNAQRLLERVTPTGT